MIERALWTILAGVFILIAYVAVGAEAWAMDAQQMATERTDQILDMLGPHGILAVLGTMLCVRLMLARRYMSGWYAFACMAVIAAVIGSGSVYFLADMDEPKAIIGGAFINILATLIAYEGGKALVGLAFVHTKKEVFRAIYFFLTPKPIKEKNGEAVIKHAPHSSLTQMMDWRPDK